MSSCSNSIFLSLINNMPYVVESVTKSADLQLQDLVMQWYMISVKNEFLGLLVSTNENLGMMTSTNQQTII